MPVGRSKINPEWLRSKAAFGGLSEKGLSLVSRYLKEGVHPAGKVLVWEGDPGDEMFLIESGEVEVIKSVKGRTVKRLAVLGEGATFGEMSLLGVFPRSATVKTIRKTTTLSMRMSDFQEIFQKNPETFTLMVMNLGREVCRRLRAMNELVAEFNLNESTK